MLRKPPLLSVPNLMRPLRGTLQSDGKRLKVASSMRALFVASGDVAVGDGDVVGGAGKAQAVGIFQADAVVPGRVDAAIRDADVAAAVDVDAVAVGVDLQVVDGEVVHAGGEDGEVSAVQDRDIAESHVAAVFQADGFVADAGCQGEVAVVRG